MDPSDERTASVVGNIAEYFGIHLILIGVPGTQILFKRKGSLYK